MSHSILSQLFGLTLCSRILGCARDLILAWTLGAGLEADILACALRIPHFIRKLLAEGNLSLALTTALITIRAETAASTQIQPPWDLLQAQILLTLHRRLFCLLTFLLLLLYLSLPYFVPYLIQTETAQRELLLLMQQALPYVFFAVLSALCMGALHAGSLFWVSASSPILLNLVLIGTLLLIPVFDLPVAKTFTYGIVLGGLVQWLWQEFFLLKMLAARHSIWRFIQLSVGKKVSSSQKAHLYPTEISTLCSQILGRLPAGVFAASCHHILFFISLLFLARWQEGQAAAQFYAERLLEIPMGLIAVCIGTKSLPRLGSFASKARLTTFSRELSVALHWLVLLLVPVVCGIFAVSSELIGALYGHGHFDAHGVTTTETLLLHFLCALPALCVTRILLTATIALEKLRSITLLSACCLALALLLCLCKFYPPTVVVAVVHIQLFAFFGVLWRELNKKHAHIRFFVRESALATFVGSFACAGAWALISLLRSFGHVSEFCALLLSIALALLLWISGLFFLSPREWQRIRALFKKRQRTEQHKT